MVLAFKKNNCPLDTLMVREKNLSLNETRSLLTTLKELYPSAKLLLNWKDSFEIATLPIDGIHLSVEVWRKLFFKGDFLQIEEKTNQNISLAIHSHEEWIEALSLGCRPNYVLISPVFETTCKPDAKPLGLEQARQLCEHIHTDLPKAKVVGLGGFKVDGEDLCLSAGLDGFAMRSGFFA